MQKHIRLKHFERT